MRRRAQKRGTTVIEVLVAISILAIGASGLIALQKGAVVANREAKNLEIANEIARTWVERLRADAVLWNHPSSLDANSDLDSDTVWLSQHVQEPGSERWFRPENTARAIYGEHDLFGKDDGSASHDGPFCVNLRLSWLRSEHRLIRAEVRVYWMRQNIQQGADSLSMEVPEHICGATASAPPNVDAATDVFHVIHVTTALAQNTAN